MVKYKSGGLSRQKYNYQQENITFEQEFGTYESGYNIKIRIIDSKSIIFVRFLKKKHSSKLKNSLNMSEIAEKVKSIIVDKLGVEMSEVTPEASFSNDLGADSLDTVELIMEFEKEFNLSIPDEAAEKIATVGDAIKYLEENKH